MKQTLEQAAEEYAQSLSKGAMTGKEYCKQDFKAGAKWQKKQMCKDCPNRGNTHSYLKGYEDGKKELTWQDVKQIVNIADMLLVDDIHINGRGNFPEEQRFYEEVLNVFNEQKNTRPNSVKV